MCIRDRDNASMITAVSESQDGLDDARHASVAEYGTSKEILKKIISDHGKLPFLDKDVALAYSLGQVHQTNLFFEYGEVVDHTKDFYIMFHDGEGFRGHGDEKNPCIVTSVEAIVDPEIKFINK